MELTLEAVDLADWLREPPAGRDATGQPSVAFVDLAGVTPGPQVAGLAEAVTRSHRVLIGISSGPAPPWLTPLTEALTCTLVAGGQAGLRRTQVGVASLDAARAAIAARVAAVPLAAVTLADLLRLTSTVPVGQGLVAESMARSMLLAGPESARCQAARRPAPGSAPAGALRPDPVIAVARDGSVLRVQLNDPAQGNRFTPAMRDGLAAALDLALADDTITSVVLTGAGPSFCGGDPVGPAADVAADHVTRLDGSVAARVARCAGRVRVIAHGACTGPGAEIAAFAGRLIARPGTFFQLPDLALGLVPGCGGTVGITRRIGRWRTAYLVLTGIRLDLPTALRWGLADARGDG